MRLRSRAMADVEPNFDKGTEHTRKQCKGEGERLLRWARVDRRGSS